MSDPVAEFIAKRDAAILDGSAICEICGQVEGWVHDHKPDQSGLDDGPYLRGHAPRKKPIPRPADEISLIRKQAWATRRAKYGPYGHR